MERLGTLRELYAREQHRLYQLVTFADVEPGFAALPLEAVIALDRRHHSSKIWPKAKEQYGDDLTIILDRLGITHVILTDTSPSDPRTPILLDPLPADAIEGVNLVQEGDGPLPKLPPLPLGEPLMTILPSRGGVPPQSARLPWVMDFPLRDLWQVERPGPVLALYAWPRSER